MPTVLNDVEVRVLGSLIEKQVTTPEYYPLTLNSLTLACNQKNNRNPVTTLNEEDVAKALETLREKNLTYVFHGSTSRVPKYKHVMPEVFHLNHQQLAIMCVLMLRGAQTPGELRGSTSRLFNFTGLEEVEQTLDALISREPEPLVARLARQLGQKEVRFAHLLSGELSEDLGSDDQVSPKVRQREPDRIAQLEGEVASLKTSVEELRQQFEKFRQQFE